MVILGIIVAVLVIGGIYEAGEKSSSSEGRTSKQVAETAGGAIAQGLKTFNAGLREIGGELERHNLACEIVQGYRTESLKVIAHFKLCASRARLLKTYAKFEGEISTLRDLNLFDVQNYLAGNGSYRNDNGRQGNRNSTLEILSATDSVSREIAPLSRPVLKLDLSSLTAQCQGNEAVESLVNSKLADILKNTREELKDVNSLVSSDGTRKYFDMVLSDLGETELFDRLRGVS